MHNVNDMLKVAQDCYYNIVFIDNNLKDERIYNVNSALAKLQIIE